MVKFLDGGFSFGLIYPRFGAEEDGNLKISIDTDKKFPNKSRFFLAKRLGEGKPRKTIYTMTALIQLNTSKKKKKNCGPTPIHASKGPVQP